MRVITGKAKGVSLKTLDGLDVRPTTDMVKGSIFNSLQFDIEGRKILDLFAGSGQLGIEALSRGAEKAVFVDKSRQSADVVKINLEKTKLSDFAQVIICDCESFLKNTRETFDIAFLDPPYNCGLAEAVLPLLTHVMSSHGKIICEHDRINPMPDKLDNSFIKQKEYGHGRVTISIYGREE